MIIDLSLQLSEQLPVIEGDPETKVRKVASIQEDGFCMTLLSSGTHTGTHIDAPSHMISDGKSLIDFDISKFKARGRLIVVDDLKFSIDRVKETDIKNGDIVLFYTGLDKKISEKKTYFEEYPQIPEDVAQHLVDKEVGMVGMDMLAPDHYPDFPIHKLLLSNDILIIENLTNLGELKDRDFTVTALPLKVDTEASPARVIAELI